MLIERGWAQIQLGKPAAAAVDFRKAVEREPASAALRLGLFLTAAELGDQIDANDQWRRVLDDHDEPRTDRWNTAEKHLSLLTERRGESWWFWRARGHLKMRMGHPDQSEADYDKAIHARTDDGWSWLGRGLARKKLNQIEPALSDLTQSVALEPKVATGWAARGEILGAKGRWDEAAGDFARWFALGGDPVAIPWYYHALLRAYAKDQPGYRQACATMWERFSKTSDPFVASLVAHACSLEPECGVAAESVIALAERAAGAKPEDGWNLFTLGAALRRAGRSQEAVAKFVEATFASPRGTYIPLVAAMRQVTRRSFPAQSENAPGAQLASTTATTRDVNSKSLASEIKNNNAAWQYQVEAILLGRELDKGASTTRVQDKPTEHRDDG
jgi:tetratricopeptide (TPR) repeat protein